jgi:ribosomal protein S18 acetylase RimI-like enzyme
VSEPGIRSATQADLDSVLQLWSEATGQGSTDTHVDLHALLECDCEALLVAEAEGVLAGTLIAAWDGWRGNLYRLAVRAGHRRRGIATALLREGERRLRARGAKRLAAIVDERCDAALAFWQAAGYVREARQARLVRPVGRGALER